MTEKLNFHIAQLQMLSLSLSTQTGAEERKQTLIKIREESYKATSEITLHRIPVLRTINIRPHKPTFGVDDI